MLIEQLVQIRKEKKIKQLDLAAQIGVSVSHLCQIEKGQVMPSYKVVERMIEQLGHKLVLIRYE